MVRELEDQKLKGMGLYASMKRSSCSFRALGLDIGQNIFCTTL